MAVRDYVLNGLHIHWDSDKCEKCHICKTELPLVFDPDRRPWVRLDLGDAKEIRDTVSRCPTQALHDQTIR